MTISEKNLIWNEISQIETFLAQYKTLNETKRGFYLWYYIDSNKEIAFIA